LVTGGSVSVFISEKGSGSIENPSSALAVVPLAGLAGRVLLSVAGLAGRVLLSAASISSAAVPAPPPRDACCA